MSWLGGCSVVSLFLCALVVFIFFFVCDKSAGVTHGKRVGLYSTGRCNQGPIESIKLAENE